MAEQNRVTQLDDFEQFVPPAEVWQKQEATSLGAGAFAAATQLRAQTRQRLESGEVVDPLETGRAYQNATVDAGGSVAVGGVEDERVLMRNAVAYEDNFRTLPTYENQRRSLALFLAKIGVLSNGGVEDVVLVMNSPRPDDHRTVPPEHTKADEEFQILALGQVSFEMRPAEA